MVASPGPHTRERIVLIGLRGAGKTTVGRRLATALGWPFADTDEDLARESGRSAAEWLRTEGETVFRAAEQRVVARLATCPRGVLALGGGTPLDEANRRALAGWTIIWLAAPVSVLAQRVLADGGEQTRPSLTGQPVVEELARQHTERAPIYQAWQHHVLDATLAPEALVGRIGEILADGGRRAGDAP